MLLEKAWDQLLLVQATEEYPQSDIIYIAAKHASWDLLCRLMKRSDLDISININRIAAVVMDKAIKGPVYQSNKALDVLCKIISNTEHQQDKLFSQPLVYDMVRFASTCGNELFKNTVLSSECILQWYKNKRI